MSRLPLALSSEEGGTLRIFAIEQGRIAIRQEGPGSLSFEVRMDLAVTACPVCEWAVDAAGECGCP